jgi:hypothetical protein
MTEAGGQGYELCTVHCTYIHIIRIRIQDTCWTSALLSSGSVLTDMPSCYIAWLQAANGTVNCNCSRKLKVEIVMYTYIRRLFQKERLLFNINI